MPWSGIGSSTGGSTGGTGGIPLWAWLAMGGGQAVLGQLDANANRNQQTQLTDKEIAAQVAARQQATAVAEEGMNPFRQQAQQVGTAAGLDQLARGKYTPVQMSVPGKMAKYVPQFSGGYSYDKSPALINAANAAETDVLAGHTAPTMTNPANYGKTAALTLDANGNPTGPSRPGAGGGAPSLSDLEASYTRRNQGSVGVTKGAMAGFSTAAGVAPFTGPAAPFVLAGGAIAGAIAGAAHKHASSAMTDFKVDDARDAITKAITYYQGRQPAQGEVDAILKGQGWKPGDHWVGEAGLTSVLRNIAGSQG